MKLDRRQFIAGAVGALLLSAPEVRAHANGARTQVFGGNAFGTYWRATLPATADPAIASSAMETMVEAVDLSMSPFRVDSEITRFNLRRSATSMEASAEFCAVARESIRVAELSNGAFDPTVGPLVHRFGFGPIVGGLGTYAGIDAGIDRIEKADEKLTLDLCGVAKGFALDGMVAALTQQGLTNFLVELGGEVKSVGTHPAGRPWQIAVETPGARTLSVQRLVRLDGLALATSGVSINGLDYRGRHYGHIIDPRSGTPVDNDVLSVSVLAPTAMEADALATALLVMGPEDGGRLAESIGRPALFLHWEEREQRETVVAGFADHILT